MAIHKYYLQYFEENIILPCIFIISFGIWFYLLELEKKIFFFESE